MTIRSRNNIQKSISIPSRYDATARARIGELMVQQIRKRTASGVSVNGTAFKYAKNSTHKGDNLTDSGDMMIQLDVLDTRTGAITIGYEDTSSLEANQAEGNSIGSYGGRPNASIAKPFIGVSNDELDLILSQFDQEAPTPRDDDVESFIAGILNNQGL